MRLRGLLARGALVVGLMAGTDPGYGAHGARDPATWPKLWPQPALGDTGSGDTEVLFTFDDGPNPLTTPAVLDVLAEHEVRAVFFLVGKQVEKPNKEIPAILDRIVREGHILANHTMAHSDLCKETEAEAIADLDGGRAAIERAAAVKLSWFRAPFGVRCDRLDALLAERHLTHLHWDLDPQEWKHGVDEAIKYVTGQLAHASGRNVLLMHDSKPVTAQALPLILDWIEGENERRGRSHKHRIKVLQAPDLAVERQPPEIMAWLADAVAGVRALPGAVAGALP